MLAGKRRLGASVAVLTALACGSAAAKEDKTYKVPVPKTTQHTEPPLVEADKPRGKDEARARADAVKYHIKNLSDKDPEVRQNSATILGQLGAVDAVPYLIEALKDDHVLVQMYAHGSLNRITGKNFGYRNYAEWKGWWETNKDEFIRKQASGVGELREQYRAPASNTQGLLYLANGNYEEAYRMFLDAVNSDPKTPDYRNNLGLAVMELARNNPVRYIDAILYFREAIGLDESLPQPYMNIGSCFARLGKHIEAQHWFRIAIQKDVNGMLWEHCWTLGKDLLQRGDFHLALEYLEQARSKSERLRKSDPRIYRDLALAYYGLDMYHSAWREILNLRARGFEAHPDFVAKVRQALQDQGVDPDKEEQKARQESQVNYSESSTPPLVR